MKPPARISLRLATTPRLALRPSTSLRAIHTTLNRHANVAPIVGTGPPPEAPIAADASSGAYHRVERRRRQADMLKLAKDVRDGKVSKKAAMQKRFWSDVSVRETDGLSFPAFFFR